MTLNDFELRKRVAVI